MSSSKNGVACEEMLENKEKTSLFEKICTNAFISLTDIEKLDSNEMGLELNSIQYGNLTRNYNPDLSMTTIEKQSLYLETEIESCFKQDMETDECNPSTTSNQINLIQLLNSSNNTSGDWNDNDPEVSRLKSLNLVRRKSLLYLIERNRGNHILCPFDELAYFKLNQPQQQQQLNSSDIQINLPPIQAKIEFKLFSLSNANDYLVPTSVSTYLMPFFLDIFQPSTLKLFPKTTLDILLKLKRNYKPQLYLDNDNLFSLYILQDLLWNCFGLLNYKFDSSYKYGFLNYYLSLFCILKYYEIANANKLADVNKKLNLINRIQQIKGSIKYYVEALILNGFLDLNDLSLFEGLYLNKLNNKYNIGDGFSQNVSFNKFVQMFRQNLSLNGDDTNEKHELVYLEEAINMLQQIMLNSSLFPLKLKYLSRIKVKQTIKEFNVRIVNELKLPDLVKDFLLFNQEFDFYFNQIESLKN